MRRILVSILVPVTALALLPGATVCAAEPVPEPPPAAYPPADAPSAVDEYIARGGQYFKSKQFVQAAEEVKKAYALDPRPMFLFNMAQAYRRAGRVVDARSLYQRYLQADPHTSLRGETENNIAELGIVIAERERAERERKRPVYKKAWFWGVVGTSAAVVIGVSLGVGLGVGLRDDRAVVDLPFALRR